jgi:hypothetical protein
MSWQRDVIIVGQLGVIFVGSMALANLLTSAQKAINDIRSYGVVKPQTISDILSSSFQILFTAALFTFATVQAKSLLRNSTY